MYNETNWYKQELSSNGISLTLEQNGIIQGRATLWTSSPMPYMNLSMFAI